MTEPQRCPVCKCSAEERPSRSAGLRPINEYVCELCGEFSMFLLDSRKLLYEELDDCFKVSRSLRELQVRGQHSLLVVLDWEKDQTMAGYTVVEWEQLLKNFPVSFNERMNRSIINFACQFPEPGKKFDSRNDALSIALTYSKEGWDCRYVIDALVENRWLVRDKASYTVVSIAPRGWAYIDELRRGGGRLSDIAFIAMSFKVEKFEAVRGAIERGVKGAGYQPYISVADVHNRMIDNEIIAKIRESRFVVADFTDQRQNVYFEAGFAFGLGKEVIKTCRRDQLDVAASRKGSESGNDFDSRRLHFDVRQFLILDWSTHEELASRLTNWIKATIV